MADHDGTSMISLPAPRLTPPISLTAAPTVAADANAPIGLFDSGIGGLSVYQHLATQLPAEKYIYYADTLHVPYGSRDSAEIAALTLAAVEWLYQQGCKLIVIACNSASAYALTAARRAYPQIPIVGLVPALKPAVLASRTRHVAVLATKATLNGALLNQVIDEVAEPQQTTVTKYFDPELVPWVEAGMPEGSETAIRLRQQVTHFANSGVDHLVLGCTHYPFFKDFLRHEIQQQQLGIDILDSGQAIAARVQHLLAERHLLAMTVSDAQISLSDDASSEVQTGDKQSLIFYASKDSSCLSDLVQRLLGPKVRIAHVS